VWAAVVVVVLVLLATIAVQVFAATSGRHRAEAAADLGALAAAGHVVDGGTVACAYAARVAERMAARLVECSVSGWEVRVEVSVTPALTLPGAGEAHGRARAGPVTG
jgi:secretion/DNA translocation related TadE-like protein